MGIKAPYLALGIEGWGKVAAVALTLAWPRPAWTWKWMELHPLLQRVGCRVSVVVGGTQALRSTDINGDKWGGGGASRRGKEQALDHLTPCHLCPSTAWPPSPLHPQLPTCSGWWGAGIIRCYAWKIIINIYTRFPCIEPNYWCGYFKFSHIGFG